MRVLVQWSRLNPQGWEAVQSEDWARAPKKPRPPPRDLDDNPGWVHALNVQGVHFTGDHYAVEHVSDTETRVFCLRDDPSDYPDGEKHAHLWTFKTLARDPKFGGAWNTRQISRVYAQPGAFDRYKRNGWVPGNNLFSWDGFVPPAEEITRHGVKVAGQHHRRHTDLQTHHGWREWTEGVPASELVNGRIPDQRSLGRYNVPDGTKTYYHNTTDLATGVHKADHENELGTSVGPSGSEAASIAKNSQELAFVATTASGQPGSGTWPTGNYRYQIHAVETVGADITYGLLTIGSAGGHFGRVSSDLLSHVDTKTQTDPAYTGEGLKLAQTGSVSWSSGSDTDRFEVVVAAGNSHDKDAEPLTLQLGESDDYADGPWTASTAPTGHFMGFVW